jgi:hypothetical protein
MLENIKVSLCALARSAQVSVKLQKYGGLSVHPMGRLKGRPRMGLLMPSCGRITARLSEACALRGIR